MCSVLPAAPVAKFVSGVRRPGPLAFAGLGLLLAATATAAEPGACVGSDRPAFERHRDAFRAVAVPETASVGLRGAAEELARHLAKVFGHDVRVAVGDEDAGIHVGPTEACRGLEKSVHRSGAEGWGYAIGEPTCLVGADDRGRQHAVYRFLDEQFDIAWWTADVTRIPLRNGGWTARGRASCGRPAFEYRDVFPGVEGAAFAARSGWNGSFSRRDPAWGGRIAYGGPYHVHNLYRWLPPEEHFADHPEWYSERAGFRTADRAQLCMTQPAVAEALAQRIRDAIRTDASLPAPVRPKVYAISIMDWGRACRCGTCRAFDAAHGGPAGSMVLLANRVAERLDDAGVDPAIELEVLAYLHALEAPEDLPLHPRIRVRVAVLQGRDLLRPIRSQPKYLDVLRGWSAVSDKNWIWIYPATYGEEGELPTPNLRALADDLRLAREFGYDGVFSEHSHPADGDRRALKGWVISRLMLDPSQDVSELERTFAHGYYGAAGRAVLTYGERLRRIARGAPPITFERGPGAYDYLTPRAMRRLDRILARGLRAVGDDARLTERVERVRLNLDRARLHLDPGLRDPVARRPVLDRFERVRRRAVEALPDSPEKRVARENLTRELAALRAG